MTDQKKPLHTDIPIETAWQTGRRIYVRTSSKSTLGTWMRDQGAHWDKTTTPWCLWMGSTKKDRLIPEIRKHLERVAALKEKKATLTPVRIPYDRTDLRQIAKDADGMWDKPNKQWFVPAEVAEQIRALLAAEVAEAVAIPIEADLVTHRARELGASWDRERRMWCMSVEAAADVRALLRVWQSEQDQSRGAALEALRRQRAEQAERERMSLVAEAGRTPVEGAELRRWGTDMIGHLGQVVVYGEQVYVLVEVEAEYDGPDDYTPAWTYGIEVHPTDEDRAVMAYRAEKRAVAKERRALTDAIRDAGEAPKGHHEIDAEALMSTWNPYGGGDWICITDQYVWYVKNNGADGDTWAYNNVRTSGAGAIGWRIDRATDTGEALAQQVLALAERHNALTAQTART